MAIKKIRISNFKSFKDLEIELGKFNVLIGANASGKSNFIQIFKFLRDITNYGLDNAISMQGGVEYLRNIDIGSSENFSLEVVSDQKSGFSMRESIGVKIYETIYKVALKFKKRGAGFEIADDKLTLKCEVVKLEKQKIEEKYEQIEITISNVNGNPEVDLNPSEGTLIRVYPEVDLNPSEGTLIKRVRDYILSVSLFSWLGQSLGSGIVLLERPTFFIPFVLSREWENIFNFNHAAIYDFDPGLPKKSVPITGKRGLEEDGSNLAIVLKNIIENKDRKRKFSNLVKYLLPFVEDLGVEKFADRFLLLKFQEIYFRDLRGLYLPAFLMSDGTINIVALIVALYFEERPLTIIEDPARNIHPYLISRVIELMKEVSQKKQIIVTTHNPEIVKYADLENILLVSRRKDGFSTIFRPSEKKEVKIFLKNEIGIEDLYIQNLLEI